MNSVLKFLVIAAFWIGLVLGSKAQGILLTNGVVIDPLVTFRVIQSPTTLDYTSVYFSPQGGNTFEFMTALDEGVRVFFVAQNDPVSFQGIQSGTYSELMYPNDYLLQEGEPFFVGLYTGYNPWVIENGMPVYTGIYEDPVFGWAQLENNAGTIQLLGGATVYQAGGIYAGTLDIIPEPSAMSLFALGLTMLGWRKATVWLRSSERG